MIDGREAMARERLEDQHRVTEEAISAAFWPGWAHRWLLREHARLRRRGNPFAEVKRHARAELRLFERFSPWAVGRIESEHRALGFGEGRSSVQ